MVPREGRRETLLGRSNLSRRLKSIGELYGWSGTSEWGDVSRYSPFPDQEKSTMAGDRGSSELSTALPNGYWVDLFRTRRVLSQENFAGTIQLQELRLVKQWNTFLNPSLPWSDPGVSLTPAY
ncbi:hypothetical protein CC2G_012241 [Coprinopsis cinerea AmutBmut pab1-1]|nr:hypothetical protein CC2G_012241 [Coprinopsis cinerea AmutBmut pab1-1]